MSGPNYVPQVGGEHYQSEYQHWDWVIDVKMGYLEGCATKYACRWRHKNGLDDLRKARSFVVKLRRTARYPRYVDLRPVMRHTARFGAANRLPALEFRFCVRLATWSEPLDLERALELIDELIAGAEQEPAPVPLTEENHYAEREGEADAS